MLKLKKGKYCVYTHSHRGKVVYIGKGIPQRPFDLNARSKRWLEFFNTKESVQIDIVGWFDDEKKAIEKERKLIRKFQPICNTNHLNNKNKRKKIRKTEVFSVSFQFQELVEIQEHLEELENKFGFSFSRNELIRKATLAHVRHQRNGKKDYDKEFKQTD